MNGFVQSLAKLGPLRLGLIGVAGLAVLGLMAFLALRTATPQMALLYADLDPRDGGSITDALDRQKIPYKVEANGTRILVPALEVGKLRLSLARQGLPSGGSIGYEIFDKGDSLTTTAFQQNINQLRALEGELARTIRQIQTVRAARVHLVLPKREPFARERADPQASVMLTMNGAGRLDREQVQAILHLVSAAVPGLSTRNISVVDNRGELLARAGEAVGGLGLAMNAEELRRAEALRLSRSVEELLERVVGPGRVRAEATVELDFERITINQESFDPEQQVVRSTQTVNEANKTTEQQSTTSVANNLPNPPSTNGNQAGSNESRNEETINYEIGKTVRSTVREAPILKRLSVAVLVDGVASRAADGTLAWAARSPDELGSMVQLVRAAVGFDEKRGDRVEVVNVRFLESTPPEAEPAGLFGMQINAPEVVRMGETLVFGVVAALVLLLVVRPMLARLTDMATGSSSSAELALAEALGTVGPGGTLALPGSGGGMGTLGGLPGVPALGPNGELLPALAGPNGEADSLISLSNIEGQMRASSLRKLNELVSRNTDETVTILRNWMQGEE